MYVLSSKIVLVTQYCGRTPLGEFRKGHTSLMVIPFTSALMQTGHIIDVSQEEYTSPRRSTHVRLDSQKQAANIKRIYLVPELK